MQNILLNAKSSALVLEDGTVFRGRSVGADGLAAGEACFTTAPTGYEEATTDPSYVAQVLCFAYPLVGNYGVDGDRMESDRIQVEGVVMRRARPEVAAWFRDQCVVALDRRRLAKPRCGCRTHRDAPELNRHRDEDAAR